MIEPGPMLLAVIVASICVVGRELIGIFDLQRGSNVAERLCWSIAGGAAWLALGLALLWWAWPASYGAVSALGFPVVSALLLRTSRVLAPTPPSSAATSPPLSKSNPSSPVRTRWSRSWFVIAALLLCAPLALELLAIQNSPSLVGDEGFVFGLKAQAIRAASGLGEGYAELLQRPTIHHSDYPLGVPVLRAWVQAIVGGPAFVAERWPIQLLGVALIAGLFGTLARRLPPLWTLALATAVLAAESTSFVLVRAQGEVPVALGLLLAADGITRARFTRDGRWLGLCGVGLTLAMLAKNEARLWTLCLALATALTVIAAHHSKRACGVRTTVPLPSRRALASLALGLAAFGQVLLFNAALGLQNDLMTAKGSGRGLVERLIADGAERASATAGHFTELLLLSVDTGGLLFVAVLVLAASRPRVALTTPQGALVLAGWMGVGGLFVIYLVTPQPLDWHLATSARRVLWQLTPTVALGLACWLANTERAEDRTQESLAQAEPREDAIQQVLRARVPGE
ncbi:MAG: hypothetical protein ACYSWX_06980 [Planctomycetota bacterium]